MSADTVTPPLGRAAEQEPDDPVSLVGHAFKGAIAAMRRLRGRETRRHGELSDAQYGLLFGLCEHPEQSISELAYAADLSPASATEMLDGLARAGLVHRARSERDRRVVLVSLTEHGQALVDDRRARCEPRWRAALGDFSDAELHTAAAVLDRLRALFDEFAER